MTPRDRLFLGIGVAGGLAVGYQAPEVVERLFEMGLGAVGFFGLLVLALCMALFVPLLQDVLTSGYRHAAQRLGKLSIGADQRQCEEDRPPVNPWGMPNPPYPSGSEPRRRS